MSNKIWLAAACALACVPAAHAIDGSVTLYGKLDVFAEYDSGGGQGNRSSIESGGLNGTRWGMKGDTSLASVAPGLKAVFKLEGGLFANNGRQAQSSRLFGRQAYAGVEGGFGSLTVGRQYTPLLNTVVNFDPFGQGYGSPTNDGQVSYGLDARYDNSLIYSTPDLKGFNASAMLALGGQTGKTSRNKAFGLNAGYAAGPFEIGAAYQKDDHDLAGEGTMENVFGGVSYKLGSVKLMGGYGTVRANADKGSRTRRNEWLFGSTIDVTQNGQLWLVYGTGKTRDARPSDKSTALSAAWIQSLTKESRVYFVASVHKNDAGAALVPTGTSSYGSYSVNPGDTARGLAIGFQYDF